MNHTGAGKYDSLKHMQEAVIAKLMEENGGRIILPSGIDQPKPVISVRAKSMDEAVIEALMGSGRVYPPIAPAKPATTARSAPARVEGIAASNIVPLRPSRSPADDPTVGYFAGCAPA